MILDTRSHRNKIICCLERGGPMLIADLQIAFEERVAPRWSLAVFVAFLVAMATAIGEEPEVVIEDTFVRLPWQPAAPGR